MPGKPDPRTPGLRGNPVADIAGAMDVSRRGTSSGGDDRSEQGPQAAAAVGRQLASMLEAATGPLVGIFKRLTAEIAPFLDAIQRGIGGAAGVPGQLVGAGGAAMSGAVSPMAGMAQAAAGAFAPMAQLAGSVGSLLSALNPGLTQAMGASLRELQAAFGLLVEPIARELAPLFRELAAVLAPAFKSLQPVISTLAQAFGKVAVVVGGVFAQVLESLTPGLQALATLVADVAQALAPLFAVFGALIKALAPVLTVLVQVLAPVIMFVVKAFVYLAAVIMSLVGATKSLDEMIKAVSPQDRQQSRGLAAIQGAQYQSFADYGRSLALAAATAQGGSGDREKSQGENIKDIAETLKFIKDQGLVGIIAEGVKKGMMAAAGGGSAEEVVKSTLRRVPLISEMLEIRDRFGPAFGEDKK